MNIFIAYDNLDDKLGNFFEICAKDMIDYFAKETVFVPIHFSENKLNQVTIDIVLDQYVDKPFIFLAYSHGEEDSLLYNGNQFYLKSKENLTPFRSTMLYSFSCHSGKSFGKEIINEGGKGFFGYDNEVNIWTSYSHLFAECVNEGIKFFFEGLSTKETLKKMKDKYDTLIDDIYNKNSVVAAILLDNKDCLVFHGDETLKKDYFEIVEETNEQ